MAEYNVHEESGTGVPPKRDRVQEHLDRSRLEHNGLVSKWYEMDPETEDVLYNGGDLQEGMVVLLENPEMRVDIWEAETDEEWFRALRTNRWMMVSRIEVIGSYVRLFAEYEDGMKSKLEFPIREAWLVKRPRQTMNVFEVPGQAIGTGKYVEAVGTAQVPGRGEFDAAPDTEVWYEAPESREGRPDLKVVGKTLFEQTEAKWMEEKGTIFPPSPFSTGPRTLSDSDRPQEQSR